MKRFLMLVGVAVVAAAMYVAAAPGSQQSAGPTAKQFKALKKQVASLSKTVKALKGLAGIEVTLINDCDKVAQPIDQFGDPQGQPPTFGYEFSNDGTPDSTTTLTTALDAAPSSDTTAIFFPGGDASCGNLINAGSLQNAALKAGIRLPAAASHLPTFKAHRP
jgi:hypothetical protein